MKIYNLNILIILIYLGVLGIMTGAAILLVIPQMIMILFQNISNGTWLFMLIWIIALVAIWYIFLITPIKITVWENEINFKSFLSIRAMSLTDIRTIRTSFWYNQYIYMSTTGGDFIILNGFDQFHDFLALVESQNPRVIITGF